MSLISDFQDLQKTLTGKEIKFGINELSLIKFSSARYINENSLIGENQTLTFHMQGMRIFIYIFNSSQTTLEEIDYIERENGLTQIQTTLNNLIIISTN